MCERPPVLQTPALVQARKRKEPDDPGQEASALSTPSSWKAEHVVTRVSCASCGKWHRNVAMFVCEQSRDVALCNKCYWRDDKNPSARDQFVMRTTGEGGRRKILRTNRSPSKDTPKPKTMREIAEDVYRFDSD